jgi:hypothetical protein
MKHQPLWYVRRDGRLLGPHPRRVVIDSLLLGRFAWDDPASHDGGAWQPLKMYPEILSALEPVRGGASPDPGEPMPLSWHHERIAAARRWADERTGIERRGSEEALPDGALVVDGERRTPVERRQQRELLQVVIWRRLRRELADAYERTGATGWWWMPLLVVIGLALAIALWQRDPGTLTVSLATRAADCNAAPAPGVNWAGCDRAGDRLAGFDLRGARLSGARLGDSDLQRAQLNYADLSGSSLVGARLDQAALFGANLSGADLRGASFDGADLSFADLRNARMAGAVLARARLANAIWIDGRRCAPGSLGACD